MMQWITGVLVLIGAILVLLASIGILRLPDLFTRMQASTKASTLGLACILAGAAIQLADFSSLIRAVSIGAFVLLTSPISTHVIARAAYLTRVPLWKNTVMDEWSQDGEPRPTEEQR